ncbi:3-deoxy-D-manno-octulosonic acid transferase [Roseomonas sp. CCTCC AB2023176]|uniref:3-deoxy-D-manno-octulosonic acid transferase n=1 Tax=Roseomonas sp. CCTCC AB2023176 TaxID=3342640 RepID=UPI0035D91799
MARGGDRALPLLPLWLARRVRLGKEDPVRLHERRGEGADRPPGPLLWLHGASVGESQSLLPLMAALATDRPDLRFLVTTGTLTSARLLADRLPPGLAARTAHRFIPHDVPAHVARFLDGWCPDAGVIVESELWPNLLDATAARGIPMALINARLSERSARAWRYAPGLAARLLGTFRVVAAQTEADAARLRGLGARAVTAPGNLKSAADPLPADPAALDALRAATAGRPVLLAASTHPGEETVVAAAHAVLAARLPGLLTVIVPRHPDRGADLARDLAATGLRIARRAAGEAPGPDAALYLADTMGELGLFYRVAGAALVGKSLLPPGGGQNPLEPARLGCPILLGPYMANFDAVTERLLAAGGAIRVADATGLADAAGRVLTDPAFTAPMRAAAARIAAGDGDLPARLAAAIGALLPPADDPVTQPYV